MIPAPARRVVGAVGRRLPPPVRRAVRKVTALPRARSSVRAACGLPASAPLMVYAGRIGQDRAIAAVLDALPSVGEFHLAIVCAPPDRAAVRALVRKADGPSVPNRVHVVARPRRMGPAFLSSADLGLIGFERSTDDTALLPAVLAEYIAAGLPVVAGNARPVREYLAEHEAGDVFVPGSASSFAAAARRARKRRLPATGSTTPAGTPAPASPNLPWTPLGATPIRLGLGTANFAGQLSAFARAICAARPDVSAEVVMAKPPASFRHAADVYIHFPREHWLEVELEQIRRVLGGYTHLIVDAFRPVLGRLNGDDIGADLPALARAKIKVALLAHGSEVRDPKSHLARHKHSAFHDAPSDLLAQLITVTERNKRIATESGLPLFVTTPDLLDDLPWATWAPLVVDVDAWACDRIPLERSRPIVLHAPSQRWTKGTDQILPSLTDLHHRGVIDFRLVEGLPWDEMRRQVHDADIIVDQLTIGSYGTFGCEGMAAGKPVVAYVSESFHSSTGVSSPVVNATSATLITSIESLLDDRAQAARIGAESARYAREIHDGRRTAMAFDGFLR